LLHIRAAIGLILQEPTNHQLSQRWTDEWGPVTLVIQRFAYWIRCDPTASWREGSWIAALNPDGSERNNGQVVEITASLDLGAWPKGSRLIVRREGPQRPHPGAQLSFTDVDG